MMKAVQFTLVKSECERSCQVEEKRGGGERFEEGTKDTEASSYNDGQLLEKAGEGEGLALVKR